MLACEHYEKGKGRTEIVRSEGFSWNAWIYHYDENGNLCCSNFVAGLRWEYLTHLKNYPKCAKEVGLNEKEVKKLLSEVKREWKEVVELKEN